MGSDTESGQKKKIDNNGQVTPFLGLSRPEARGDRCGSLWFAVAGRAGQDGTGQGTVRAGQGRSSDLS